MKNTEFIALQAISEYNNPGGDDPWILGEKFYIRLSSVNEISPLENHAVFDSKKQFDDLTSHGDFRQYWGDDNKKFPHKKIAKICKSTPIGLGINGTRHYVWITEESYHKLCNALKLDELESL